LTIDSVQEHALNWMELADKDGNGELTKENSTTSSLGSRA